MPLPIPLLIIKPDSTSFFWMGMDGFMDNVSILQFVLISLFLTSVSCNIFHLVSSLPGIDEIDSDYNTGIVFLAWGLKPTVTRFIRFVGVRYGIPEINSLLSDFYFTRS